MPAVNFCSRLVSAPPICKRLTAKSFSEPPWTAVVLVSSVFALQTRSPKMNKDVHFWARTAEMSKNSLPVVLELAGITCLLYFFAFF